MAQNVSVPPFDEAPVTVVGSTPQDTFPFDFPFWDAADVLVYVDGVALDTASYAVEGFALQDDEPVEGGYGSGQVVLDDAVSNCSVTIDRFVVGDRNSQFSKSSPLGMPALNSDLNRVTARQQDLARLFRATDSGSAGASATRAEQAADRAETAAEEVADDLLATEAAVTQTGLDAEATAADRAATELLVAETAAYVSAVPPDITYASDAAGRAAVADGEDYWVRTVNGLQLYHRTNSTTSNAVAVTGFPTIFIILPNIRYFGQAQGAVMLEYISGSGTSSNTYDLKVKNPLILLAGTGENHIYEWQLPFACQGSHNVRIYQADGTTIFLGLTIVYAPDGTQAALGSFEKYDWMRARRLPSPIGDNLGTASQLIALAAPSTALKDLSKELQTFALQQPSESFPVSVQRIDEKNYAVRHKSVRYDDPDDAMDSDHVVTIFKDLAASMSLSGTTCTSALALNSEWLIRNGQEFRYCQFLSNELPGGNWTREQPSTTEPVDRFGVYGANVNDYHIVGLNHSGGIENTAADLTFTMDGVALDLEIGEIADGEELIIEQAFRIFYDAGTNRNGETLFRHTINADGVNIYKRTGTGRKLGFDAGISAPAVGATLVGGTSGAVSILCSIPAAIQTGTWGSTRAGQMFVKHVSGTWQDNEAITVGGVTVATVNGTLGQQVGVTNAYGPLMCTTTVNRIKMNGYPAFSVGDADGRQRPNSDPSYPIDPAGTWSIIGTTYGAYHTAAMNADGVGPIREMYVPSGPMTPPGDYSYCNSSKVFVEDRVGGNRKVVHNWCSAAVGSTTGAELAEGVFEVEYDIYWRIGTPA